MRVDIYRRAEADRQFSYLAVPEGRPIPQEAINIDWESQGPALEMGEDAASLNEYGMPEPGKQITEKGYAITSVTKLQP